MQINADDIHSLILNHTTFNNELFSEAIEAFFNFEFQPGWPNNHFCKGLLLKFSDAGLVESEGGNLYWTADMNQYFAYLLEVPWDPDDLFERICI